MKLVILAGGFGTRISEESHLKPKPMIEIGGRPILWHIMKMYHHYGVDEFIICLGYKGYVIKEYFANYFLHMSDVTFDMSGNKLTVHDQHCEKWKVTLVDTGEGTMTGGRLKRVQKYLGDGTFFFTYGDGLSNVDIGKLLEFHKTSGKKATLTAVQPPGRYGAVILDGNEVSNFQEKPRGDNAWINGGFFVLEPSAVDYIDGDSCSWEGTSLARLAKEKNLAAYKHYGFWQPMDTLRDKNQLEQMWQNNSPWKVWE